MRISDWSSDVCSSDLEAGRHRRALQRGGQEAPLPRHPGGAALVPQDPDPAGQRPEGQGEEQGRREALVRRRERDGRSEEHTSELQSLMRNSYAVFCLKTKKKQK